LLKSGRKNGGFNPEAFDISGFYAKISGSGIKNYTFIINIFNLKNQ
jgi:hypothetical protein